MKNVGFKTGIKGMLYAGVEHPLFPAPEGLIHYYKMNEESGSIAVDSKGNSNGNITGNSVINAVGKIDRGYYFDGTINNLIQFNSFTSITQGDFTVGFWAQQGSSISPCVFSQNITTTWSNNLFIFYVGEATSEVRIWWNGGNALTYVGSPGASSVLKYYLLRKTGSLFELFVNGVLVSTATKSGTWTSLFQGIATAKNGSTLTQQYKGVLDEFGIWNRSLTQSEITSLYNNGNGITYSLPITFIPPKDFPAIDELIAYYPLNEASGEAIDLVSNNNGIVTGSSQNQLGILDQSYLFNVDTDKIVIPDKDSLSFVNKSFTLSAWINRSTTVGNQMIINKLAGGAREWYFYILTGNLRLYLEDAAGKNMYISTSGFTFNANTWYHIVGTYDGSGIIAGLKIYVNSQLISTVSANTGFTTLRNTNSPVVVGTHGDQITTDIGFKGKIDEIGIWNKALTVNEINQLYNNGEGNGYRTKKYDPIIFVPPPSYSTEGLTHYYKLETDVLDTVGTSHGTNTGGVTYANGYAIFGGSSQFVLPANLIVAPVEYSFSLLTQANDHAAEYRVLVLNNNTGGFPYTMVALNRSAVANRIQMDVFPGAGNQVIVNTTNYDVRNVVHIAGTISKSTNTIKLYVNGNFIGSNTITTMGQLTEALKNVLGASRGNTAYLKGKIRGVGIWSKVLTDEEVLRIANAQLAGAQLI